MSRLQALIIGHLRLLKGPEL